MTEQLALAGFEARAFGSALVFSAHHGRNDALIANVARLYVPDGATVIDATWGHGGFWNRTDTTRFRLIGLDLVGGYGASARADFRHLPLQERSADVVVLDPPYVHVTNGSGPRTIHDTYRNHETMAAGTTYRDVATLYRDGMTEASRVLRPRGTCWVKCQDIVEGRQQQWAVITIHQTALELGYRAQDLFVLVNPQPPGARHAERQFHARRNHSYLWVFTKTRVSHRQETQ